MSEQCACSSTYSALPHQCRGRLLWAAGRWEGRLSADRITQLQCAGRSAGRPLICSGLHRWWQLLRAEAVRAGMVLGCASRGGLGLSTGLSDLEPYWCWLPAETPLWPLVALPAFQAPLRRNKHHRRAGRWHYYQFNHASGGGRRPHLPLHHLRRIAQLRPRRRRQSVVLGCVRLWRLLARVMCDTACRSCRSCRGCVC